MRLSALSTACRVLLLGIAVLANVAITVPLPQLADSGGEFWWPVALQVAWLNDLEAGRDIVFTYGPLGLLAEGFHPETYRMVLLVRAGIVALTILSIWFAAAPTDGSSSSRSRVLAFLLFVPIVVNVCLNSTFFLWFPFALLVVSLEQRMHAKFAQGVMYSLAGLLTLVKFSYGVMIFGVVLVATIESLRSRRVPVGLLVWSASVIVFWVLSGQSIGSLPAWIEGSLQIATGYNASQGRDREVFGMEPAGLLIVFLVSLVVFLIVMARSESRRDRGLTLVYLVGWVGLMYLLVKAGFVRADKWHVGPAVGALLLAQLTWWSFSFAPKREGRARLIDATAFTVSVAMALALVHLYSRDGLLKAVPSSIVDAVVNVAELSTPSSYAAVKREEWSIAIEAENLVGRLPDIAGTADSYPSPLGALFQPGVRYSPRPVLRSLDTYSPELAARNVQHLRTDPPGTILFAIDPKDGRLPSLEESESWPELWARYDVAGRFGNFLHLESRPTVRTYELIELASLRGELGKRFVMPPMDGVVFARFHVEPSVTGHVRSILFRAQHLSIEVERFDGGQPTFRFVPLMASKPILLSPLVEDVDGFTAIASGGLIGAGAGRVRAITLSPMAGAGDHLWTGRFEVELYRLEWLP